MMQNTDAKEIIFKICKEKKSVPLFHISRLFNLSGKFKVALFPWFEISCHKVALGKSCSPRLTLQSHTEHTNLRVNPTGKKGLTSEKRGLLKVS